MKKTFLSVIFLFSLFASGQNTWVRKLSYAYQMQGYVYTLTGVDQIEEGADGSVFFLAHLIANDYQELYKFYPNSNQVDWFITGGYQNMGVANWIESFKPTADSGIIYCRNFSDQYRVWGTVQKIDKDGIGQWSHQFSGSSFERAYDVLEKSNGEFLAIIDDSTYTFDAFGNIISANGSISGLNIQETVNQQLLVLTGGNSLLLMDTLGNILWTQSCNGYFAYDTASVYISTGSFIKKVDAVTGLQIWNKNFGLSPVSDVAATYDGGCMFSIGFKPPVPDANGGSPMQGLLVRVDSLGDTLWTRTYTFPYYGLSALKILYDGRICTGGGYLSGWAVNGFAKDYSAFCCVMNQDGTYPLAQTNYMLPGDADNNHLTNFVDDALTTMMAIGQSGLTRDTAIIGYDPIYSGEKVTVATDWLGFSSSGVNYKYADFDGNGIIDTTDITYYDGWSFMWDSFPSNYRQQFNSNIEDFCLIPLRDTVERWDTLSYYMIMGSSSNPVDSIYGFAFSYHIDDIGNVRADSAFYNSSLGTSGIDLFFFHDPINMINSSKYRAHTLICRTDFQNVYNVNDTIGIIRFNGLFSSSPFEPIISDFKAILADGTEIPFTFCSSPVIVDSLYANVHETEKQRIEVYPNPADKELRIQNGKLKIGSANVSIFNLMGEEVKTIQLTESNQTISVFDLPDGFYIGKISTDKMTNSFSFMVQH